MLVALALATLAVGCGPRDEGMTTSVTSDGREIVVKGGSSHSYSRSEGGHLFQVDGRTVLVRGRELTLNGQARSLPEFSRLEVRVGKDGTEVLVDGQPLP